MLLELPVLPRYLNRINTRALKYLYVVWPWGSTWEPGQQRLINN